VFRPGFFELTASETVENGVAMLTYAKASAVG
jgi:hypothetical protein